MFKIVPRKEASWVISLMTLLGSVLVGFIIIFVAFILLNIEESQEVVTGFIPLDALIRIFTGSLGSPFAIFRTISKSLPLIIIAAGLAVAYQGKFWNIGAEGQLLMGAIATTAIGLALPSNTPALILIPSMLVSGVLLGGLYGMIPPALKIRFGVNEVISTLMLNYLAFVLVNFLINGPMKGDGLGGYPVSDNIPDQARLAFFPGTRIPIVMTILAVLLCVTLFILLYKTRIGLDVRILGENQEAARYAGIPFIKRSLMMMIISGGAAGLAGASQITAVNYHLTYPHLVSNGYGYTAIIVAWLGGQNPLFILLSGLFLAALTVGGESLKISFGLPEATINLFNGIMLICIISSAFFQKYRIARVKPQEAVHE